MDSMKLFYASTLMNSSKEQLYLHFILYTMVCIIAITFLISNELSKLTLMEGFREGIFYK